MTETRDLDRALAVWFESESLAPAAPGVLEAVLDVTRRIRPRPRWLARWGSRWVGELPAGPSGPIGNRKTGFAMAGAAGLAVAVVALYLYFGQSNSIVGPGAPHSPDPSGTAVPTQTSTRTPIAVPEYDAPLLHATFTARPIIITVINQSDRPAKLLVGEDTSPPERIVGMAVPGEVPPHGERLVIFRVPAGRTWAIFVNRQSLIGARDVPRCAGRVPIEIHVEFDRDVFWSSGVDGSCASHD